MMKSSAASTSSAGKPVVAVFAALEMSLLLLCIRKLGRVQRADRFPRLGGRHQCSRRVWREFEPEVAGCPQVAAALVAAILLEGVDRAVELLGHDRERLALSVQKHAKRRK